MKIRVSLKLVEEPFTGDNFGQQYDALLLDSDLRNVSAEALTNRYLLPAIEVMQRHYRAKLAKD